MIKKNINKNFELSGKFHSYTIDNPGVIKMNNCTIVMGDLKDMKYTIENIKLGLKVKEEEKKKVYLAIKEGKKWKTYKL